MPQKNKFKFIFVKLGECVFKFNNDKGMINIYNDIVLPLIDKHGCVDDIDSEILEKIFDSISRNITNMTLLPNSDYKNYFLHISGEVVYIKNESKESKKELNYISTSQNNKKTYSDEPFVIKGTNSKYKAKELYNKMYDLLIMLEDRINTHIINFKSSLLTKEDYEEIIGIS